MPLASTRDLATGNRIQALSMNLYKLIALALAVLINGIAISAFVGWSAGAVAKATPRPDLRAEMTSPVTGAANAIGTRTKQTRGDGIITLAPIDVYPSAAELRALSRGRVIGG